jgi:hypothetical protein
MCAVTVGKVTTDEANVADLGVGILEPAGLRVWRDLSI